jgi:hypothetical protein
VEKGHGHGSNTKEMKENKPKKKKKKMARKVVNSLIMIEHVTQMTMEIWVKVYFTITKFVTIIVATPF